VVLLSGTGDPKLTRRSYFFAGPHRRTTRLPEAIAWSAASGSDPSCVGILRYEQGVRWVGRTPRPDPFDQPPATFRHYPGGYVQDQRTGEGRVFGSAPEVERLLGAASRRPPAGGLAGPLSPRWSKDHYDRRISALLALIRDGEVYQANLTFPLVGRYRGDPRAAIARLARHAPPFAAYIGSNDGPCVVSASPECLLWTDGRVASTYPIKGTRPRRSDPEHDADQRRQLLSSTKDRAEHLMIVDLLRNDLGRVSELGSVRVDPLTYLESFRGVHHLTSAVHGTVRPGCDLQDILHALFPGGSITGAPKRRAMEIIDDLEGEARGLYTGSIVLMGAGSAVASIAIRTAEIRDGQLRFGVGGGIVLDSDASDEWAETQTKAQALTEALSAPD
jgi:para-aminobenzoate synthetase component 1